jgi:hypothetical protein
MYFFFLSGPQKSDLLELLTQIRQGKVSSNIFVRLERLQVENLLMESHEHNKQETNEFYADIFKTAISSACIEHLDFLNDSLFTNINCTSLAIHDYNNISPIGHYKSLTDISKTPMIVEDFDYHHHVCYTEMKRERERERDYQKI